MPDTRVHYRSVRPDDRNTVTVSMPMDAGPEPNSLDALRRELADALIAKGLFKDEAQAMLESWRLSYFESEGLRVFFVLPASWTDARLPLAISAPADIARVMLGRIELVSPHQRLALKRLLELPATAFDLIPPFTESNTVLRHLHKGTGSHAEYYRMMGRDVPEALQLYDSLGRFRDALFTHERQSTRNEGTRTRLQLIISTFSACLPDLPLADL